MLDPTRILEKNLRCSIEAKTEFLAQNAQLDLFGRAVDDIVQCYDQGGRLYIAGNGGSAADAQHLAAEFVSKLSRDRDPLPAEALTVDSSIITAIGNDYGYESVFSRQLKGKARRGDVFLGITTSGNSINILKAIEECREIGILSVIFSGNNGGKALEYADYCIVAAGKTTATIQELHIVLAHSLCECVENAILQS